VKNPKKMRPGWNDPRACASFPQPVIPPAPLTGDAGRGCGDASCAPNFSAEIKTNFCFRPTNRPTFEDETSTRAPRSRHLNFS
jgi:hypothetical protein